MTKTIRNLNFPSTIRTAQISPQHPLESLTPMGHELLEIAKQIASSDELPMTEEDIENELKIRRGGYTSPELGK
jgi:hypothetical protein